MVWAGLASCTLERPRLYLDSEQAKSLLVISENSGGGAVEAVDHTYDQAYDLEQTASLVVLGYAESLAELGLKPQHYALGETGLPLPRASWATRVSLVDGDRQPLDPAALPPPLDVRRIVGARECPLLLQERLPSPVPATSVQALVPTGQGTALLATDRGVFTVSSAGISARSEAWAQANYLDIAAPQLGQDYWLARADGAILRGRPDRGFEVVHQTLPILPGSLGGSVEGDEVWAVTATRALTWRRGGRWRSLSLPFDDSYPKVAYAGPGRLVATRRNSDTILEIEDTEQGLSWRSNTFPIVGVDSVRSAIYEPELGTVVGTEQGSLFRLEDGDWRLYYQSPASIRITVAAPAFGGWLIGGEAGALAFIYDPRDTCETLVLGTEENVDLIAATPEEVFVLIGKTDNNWPIYRITRAP